MDDSLNSRYRPFKMSHMFHYSAKDTYQFVTFRTHDSIDAYMSKLKEMEMDNKEKQFEIDKYADQSTSGCYLNYSIIPLLKDIILKKDKEIYEVICFSIMPNHVHMLFKQKIELKDIMHKIKGKSAHTLNQQLEKKGRFWANDYYDRVIRDEGHLNSAFNYIKENALKAGLPDYKERFHTGSGLLSSQKL